MNPISQDDGEETEDPPQPQETPDMLESPPREDTPPLANSTPVIALPAPQMPISSTSFTMHLRPRNEKGFAAKRPHSSQNLNPQKVTTKSSKPRKSAKKLNNSRSNQCRSCRRRFQTVLNTNECSYCRKRSLQALTDSIGESNNTLDNESQAAGEEYIDSIVETTEEEPTKESDEPGSPGSKERCIIS